MGFTTYFSSNLRNMETKIDFSTHNLWMSLYWDAEDGTALCLMTLFGSKKRQKWHWVKTRKSQRKCLKLRLSSVTALECIYDLSHTSSLVVSVIKHEHLTFLWLWFTLKHIEASIVSGYQFSRFAFFIWKWIHGCFHGKKEDSAQVFIVFCWETRDFLLTFLLGMDLESIKSDYAISQRE